MSYPPPSSASYGPRAVVTRGAPGYTTGYATGGYVSGPAHYQHRAFSASPGVQVLGGSSAPPPGSLVQPSDLPPGASYHSSITRADGAIIDRYVLMERQSVPVRSVVPEVQEYQVTGQTTVPETKHIQVQKMVAVMETVMVPRQETRTVMVPEQRQKMVPQMETQAITVPKVVQTQQTMQRTVGKIIEGSKFIENERVFEYERPRPRLIQHGLANAREVGVQFTSQVGYTEPTNVQPVSAVRMAGTIRHASPPPMVAANHYVSRELYQSPGAFIQGSPYQRPSGFSSGPNYTSTSYAAPQYSTQPGFQGAAQNDWAGYGGEDKEGAF